MLNNGCVQKSLVETAVTTEGTERHGKDFLRALRSLREPVVNENFPPSRLPVEISTDFINSAGIHLTEGRAGDGRDFGVFCGGRMFH